ncbi:uncharacterized protein LOC127131933 [Lathyrus oleraceus]|uniref:uncharacterized protein LOC127131933 n=1 Tax=Pisum sativum TaxID=3888 RepID=UPI0021D16C33|nr:uncharacterized protein LOC127131933 [Pisum sativum]
MPAYAKFMNELLNDKRKLMDVALAEECSEIIQHKLPPKLTDPCRFTIPIFIGSLKIGKTLYDLGANINLMLLSMMRKIKCGEPKPTKMTLTLVDRSVTYPYGVLEDILVKVDGLLFPADFVILDMPKDTKTSLLSGGPFLATSRALIDVERGNLILRFNKERSEFEMSLVGELTYFLGLQVKRMEDSIFVSQRKYLKSVVKRFGLDNVSHKRTPATIHLKFSKDEKGVDVD